MMGDHAHLFIIPQANICFAHVYISFDASLIALTDRAESKRNSDRLLIYSTKHISILQRNISDFALRYV